MSSIAYISDENMLEYHRSMGNQWINFWRLSIRGFERFDIGSLIFFIDGRYMTKSTREKGLIGYGRAIRIKTMSPKRAWDLYEQRNGYDTKERFFEAILLASKKEEMPKQIQCIELEHVTFFKGPLFLSEFDFKLPRKLESFIYLDQTTQSILKGAEAMGTDTWFNLMNQPQETIHEDMREQKLRDSLRNVNVQWTQMQRNIIVHASGNKLDCFKYELDGNEGICSIPCSSSQQQFFQIIGIIEWIKKANPQIHFEFHVYLKKKLPIDDRFIAMNVMPVYI